MRYVFGVFKQVHPTGLTTTTIVEIDVVFERIRAHGNQIRIVTLPNLSALRGGAEVTEGFGPRGRGGLDGLQRGHAAVGDGVGELPAAPAQGHGVLDGRRHAQVGAQRDLDPGADGEAVGGPVVLGRLEHLGVALGRHELRVVDADLDDGARGHEDGLFGQHEVDAFPVQVGAVLDGVAAGAQGREDARFPVAVGRHGESRPGGLVHDGLKLARAVLATHRVVQDAEHAPRREHLDAPGAPARDEPDGQAAGVGPVGEHQRVRRRVGGRRRRQPRVHHVHGQVEEVAVARRLGDGGARRVDVGPGQSGVGDGPRQLDRVAAEVPNRREARQQDVARVPGEAGPRDRRVRRHDLREVQRLGPQEVRVAVPEAREEDGHAGRREGVVSQECRGRRCRVDRVDDSVADHDRHVSSRLPTAWDEQGGADEVDFGLVRGL